MSKVHSFLLPSMLAVLALAGCGEGSKVPDQTSSTATPTNQTSSLPITDQAALDMVSSQAVQELKWGFLDKNGHFVISPQFENVRSFSEGLASVEKKGNWGFIDKTGKLVIEAKFANANQFKNGFAPVSKSGKWGFINKQGSTVINTRYKAVKPFSEHLAAVQQDNNQWGFIDEQGKIVVPFNYQDAGSFSEDFAPVKVDGKWGFINAKDKNSMVIKPAYLLAESFVDGTASVKTFPDGGQGLPARDGVVDKNGILTLVTPLQIQEEFSEGLALYEHHNKWGFIDQDGKKVIKARYAWADKFSDQLACVRLGFKKGYIDHTGKFVIAPQLDDALAFTEGLAGVQATQEQASRPLESVESWNKEEPKPR